MRYYPRYICLYTSGKPVRQFTLFLVLKVLVEPFEKVYCHFFQGNFKPVKLFVYLYYLYSSGKPVKLFVYLETACIPLASLSNYLFTWRLPVFLWQACQSIYLPWQPVICISLASLSNQFFYLKYLYSAGKPIKLIVYLDCLYSSGKPIDY